MSEWSKYNAAHKLAQELVDASGNDQMRWYADLYVKHLLIAYRAGEEGVLANDDPGECRICGASPEQYPCPRCGEHKSTGENDEP